MPRITENGQAVDFDREIGGKIRIQVPSAVPPIDIIVPAHDWVRLVTALCPEDTNRSAAIAAALHGI